MKYKYPFCNIYSHILIEMKNIAYIIRGTFLCVESIMAYHKISYWIWLIICILNLQSEDILSNFKMTTFVRCEVILHIELHLPDRFIIIVSTFHYGMISTHRVEHTHHINAPCLFYQAMQILRIRLCMVWYVYLLVSDHRYIIHFRLPS